MRARVDQHGMIVHVGVAVAGHVVFGRHVVIGDCRFPAAWRRRGNHCRNDKKGGVRERHIRESAGDRRRRGCRRPCRRPRRLLRRPPRRPGRRRVHPAARLPGRRERCLAHSPPSAAPKSREASRACRYLVCIYRSIWSEFQPPGVGTTEPIPRTAWFRPAGELKYCPSAAIAPLCCAFTCQVQRRATERRARLTPRDGTKRVRRA